MKTFFKKINFKNTFVSVLVFSIYLKIFFILTNLSQIMQIWKYSNSVFSFYRDAFSFFIDYFSSLETLNFILSITYFISIFIFIWSFVVLRTEVRKMKVNKASFVGAIMSFIGFGCIACGQTIIYPIVLFLFSGSSLIVINELGNIILFAGFLINVYAISQNFKLLDKSGICKI